MASPFGIEPLDKTLPSAPVIAAPTAGNTDPETTLLTILRQIGALQGQPLVPESNPLLQMAAGLSGFAAGTQGRANPVLAELKADRAAQMQGLLGTAQIAGTIDSMQHRRLTEMRALKREERLDEQAKATEARQQKEFNLKLYESGKDSPDAAIRANALRRGQEAGAIPTDVDITSLSTVNPGERDKLWDTALSLIQQDKDPNDPRFGGMFEAFPVQKWKALAQAGGPQALDGLKMGKGVTPHTAFETEYLALKQIDPKARTPQQASRMDALGGLLKIPQRGQDFIERAAEKLKAEAIARGEMPKEDTHYYREAAKLTRVGDSTLSIIRGHLASNGIQEDNPQFYTAMLQQLKEISGARAFGAYDAKLDVALTPEQAKFYRNPLTDHAPPPGTTGRQAIWDGYRQVSDKDLEKLAGLDSVRQITGNLAGMAKKLITARTPGEAALQWAVLHKGALTKSNPAAAVYQDEKVAFAGSLQKALGGEVGVLTDRDINRVANALWGFGDTVVIAEAKEIIITGLFDVAAEAAKRKMYGLPFDKAATDARVKTLLDKLDSVHRQTAGATPGGAKVLPNGTVDLTGGTRKKP